VRFKVSLSILVLFILLPLSAIAAGNEPVKGAFSRVPGQQFKYDGKTVEVVEFLSFYCSHCYAFEKSIPVIKGNFPKKIRWRIVPIYWKEGSSKPGEAYFLAVDAGKGEEMKKALFRANFVEKRDIGDVKVLDSLAVEAGLGFDFSHRLRAGEKAPEARKALDLAGLYKIEETPTVVIAGNIMTNPHASGHNIDAFRDNVITILKSIIEQNKAK
jgi:thiol:disulfide interchange protein DsbA